MSGRRVAIRLILLLIWPFHLVVEAGLQAVARLLHDDAESTPICDPTLADELAKMMRVITISGHGSRLFRDLEPNDAAKVLRRIKGDFEDYLDNLIFQSLLFEPSRRAAKTKGDRA